MIDLNWLKDNLEEYKKSLVNRQMKLEEFKLDEILRLYADKKKISAELQELQRKRNTLGGKIQEAEKAKEIKKNIRELNLKNREIIENLYKLEVKLPNILSPDVPIGKNESENKEIEKWGEIPKFNFTLKDHLEIGKNLDLIDMGKASIVSGARFYYLKNEAVLIEFALLDFVFKMLIKQGFIPVIPPVMVKSGIMKKMGKERFISDSDAFYVEKDDLYLVGSAEHTIGPLHMDDVLKEEDLPKRYVGFSTSFRREAGSYGKDTRGILRAHQFDKIEMFSFAHPDKSEEEHQLLLSMQKKIMQALELSYRVIILCSGDTGITDFKQYDLETWIPTQNKYRETHSCSNVGEYQSRGINARYKNKETGKNQYAHTLNATGIAIGRVLIAILENNQQQNGSVKVPKVLQDYIGKSLITMNK